MPVSVHRDLDGAVAHLIFHLGQRRPVLDEQAAESTVQARCLLHEGTQNLECRAVRLLRGPLTALAPGFEHVLGDVGVLRLCRSG